eukprot:14918621-Alexandrium_andersonii.AAC.2
MCSSSLELRTNAHRLTKPRSSPPGTSSTTTVISKMSFKQNRWSACGRSACGRCRNAPTAKL